jgi:dCMP deaminase
MRPSWDDYYLGIAQAASRRGDCTRSQVGAVIVVKLRGKHLISIGFNGVNPGEPGCLSHGACPRGRFSYDELPSTSDYSNCISTHGEINAFYNATFSVDSGTVYVTRSPCTDCQDFLFREGIVRFVYPNGIIDAQG